MAGDIKGITIEFRGDTTQLDKALRQITNETKALDRELKAIDRALKFNPGSVDLWRQKQTVLNQKVQETKQKLDTLREAKKKLDDDPTIDKESAEYRELQREIVETESKLKHFEAQLRQVGNVNLRALGEQFKQIGAKMTEMGKNLTMKVTLPLAAAGAVAVNKFAEVDKIMQLTNSTMGNSAEEAELLNKAMKEAAASSTFGMNDAATATLNFARAGLSAEEAASALAPAMALAAGEGGDLDTVSAGLTATINGFGDSFDNAATYADVFANACNNSALDVNSLSEAMSVAAPIFAAAGYSVNDAALYMGVMANKGIDANKAANSLKTGISRLISPTDEAATWMDKLGFSITDADGNMKDSVTIQRELHESFSQLSESEQIAAASAIFGKNQMTPWLALINTAPEDVNALNTALGESGTAMEMQAAMMQGFGGSIEQLKSGIDVLATSFGEALAPTLQKVIGVIQSIIDWFNGLSSEQQALIANIGLVVAAIGPVLVILGTLASSIGSIISLVGMVLPAIAGVVAALGPVILIIGAVIAAGVLLYKNWDTIKAKAIEIRDNLIATWNNIKASVIAAVNNLKATLSGAWDSVKATVSAKWNAIKTAITTPIQNAVDIVRSAIDKIKNIVNNAKLSLPHIKLPHFSISGKFSLNPPSIPKVSVSWYKSGGIFSSPTIAGIGEAGPEAVVPLDILWKKLDNIAAASSSGGDSITINVYGSAGMDVNELAAAVEERLVRLEKQRVKAWGY